MSQSKPLHFRLCLASPGGFEPLTPRLGGECSIQLSYEDMSDFWLKIGISATFQASGSVTGYSITYAFWMNCSIQLSSIHSPLVASYITLTLTDSNYRVLFPIVQRRQASPFLRSTTLRCQTQLSEVLLSQVKSRLFSVPNPVRDNPCYSLLLAVHPFLLANLWHLPPFGECSRESSKA